MITNNLTIKGANSPRFIDLLGQMGAAVIALAAEVAVLAIQWAVIAAIVVLAAYVVAMVIAFAVALLTGLHMSLHGLTCAIVAVFVVKMALGVHHRG